MRIAPAMLASALLLLTATAHAGNAADDLRNTPGGTYQLDPRHASITFKIEHLGFSRYTGRFDKMDATLHYDNAAPEKSTVEANISIAGIDTNDKQLEDELRNDKWFNAAKFPTATFKSTKVEITNPTTAKITGDFTLMGVTQPIELDATLIGTGTHPMLKKAVIGFSATGLLQRSAYGLTNGVPFVGDNVVLQIEAEFDKAD